MSVRDPATNSYKSYDVDVMTALAEDLGVTLEFVPTDWKTLVNGVTAGAYHVTGSASISPARMKVAGFSESYVAVEILPFAMAETAEKFDGWESVNQPGVKVATELGATFEAQSKAWFPNAEITVVERLHAGVRKSSRAGRTSSSPPISKAPFWPGNSASSGFLAPTPAPPSPSR